MTVRARPIAPPRCALSSVARRPDPCAGLLAPLQGGTRATVFALDDILEPENPTGYADRFASLPLPVQLSVDADTRSRCKTGAAVYANAETQTCVVVPLMCHRWDCDTCGPIKAKMWERQIASALPERFMLFTRNPVKGDSPQYAYDRMKAGWTAFVRAIRARFGRFEWCAIWELHKDGYPHLHVAQKGKFLPQAWLSRVAPHFGFGKVVDIQRIYSKNGCAHYMSKYMVKTLAATRSALQMKRVVWHSRQFFPKPSQLAKDAAKAIWERFATDRDPSLIITDLHRRHGLRCLPESRSDRIVFVFDTDDPDPQGFRAIIRSVCSAG